MADLARGEFKKRITFTNPTKTPDGAGGYTEVYTPFLTTWAMVEGKRTNRAFNEGMDQLIDRKDIYVYYRDSLKNALTKDTRIIYNGKEFGIEGKPQLLEEIKKIFHFEAVGIE